MLVSAWMHRDFPSASPTTSVEEACAILRRAKGHQLWIVDRRAHLWGVVDEHALLAEAARPGASLGRRPVLFLARRRCPAVSSRTPVRTAVRRFCTDEDLEALPVVDDGCLEGVLTRSDAMRALARLGREGAPRAKDAREEAPPPCIWLG